ncbi:sulfatase-like hydrolase/transferase [Polaribacter sp.]|nr:sulfatase-like hydrolase/transferase [Polaribacter sp.]
MSCSSPLETPIDSGGFEVAKPNILLVIADDMGKDAMPNFSEGTIKPNMPTLQSLMNSGITFDNFWSYPVCTPTRASVLTGKYGVNTNVIDVGDPISTAETSLQSYINSNTNNDYATSIIGKWHLSNSATDPITMGIDYFAGIVNGGVGDYFNWNFNENGTASNSRTYTTTKLTDFAIDWVDDQTKPWFLWMAYNAPHTPFHLAPTELHSQGNLPTDEASINANPIPYYMSAIEAMDTELGRFLSNLSSEERANTVIIFIGDNGTPGKVAQNPYSRLTVKGTLYQGGVNVPMIVSGVDVTRAGEREDALIQTTDLFATIANITGVSVSEIHNSKSFYPQLTSATNDGRSFVYTEIVDGYAIRNATYKLMKYDNGDEELYNLVQDPYENRNLIGTTLSAEATNEKANLISEAIAIRN